MLTSAWEAARPMLFGDPAYVEIAPAYPPAEISNLELESLLGGTSRGGLVHGDLRIVKFAPEAAIALTMPRVARGSSRGRTSSSARSPRSRSGGAA